MAVWLGGGGMWRNTRRSRGMTAVTAAATAALPAAAKAGWEMGWNISVPL